MTLTTIVAAVMLMGLSCCGIANAQISDAQIGDVQVPNSYVGGARGNEGFFFGAEGLYWALPSPKSSVVGNESVEGENAFDMSWTVLNSSTKFFLTNDSGDDDDDDDDDDSSSDSDSGGNTGDNINGTIISGSSSNSDSSSGGSIEDAIKDGYTEMTLPEFIDYTADKYGPCGVLSYTTQHNDWNTNQLSTKFHVGQRYNFGFMSGHNGWECQIFTIDGKTAEAGRGVQVGFADTNNNNDGLGSNYLAGIIMHQKKDENWQDCTETPEGNLKVDRLLVQFDKARMWNDISTWGVELNYLRRAHQTRLGRFELGLGVRYMKWDEDFGFWGGSERYGTGEIYSPNFLDDTTIETNADNNLVGPQIGIKWSRQTGRFGMEVLAKFTAAYNAQQVTMESTIASNGYASGLYGFDSIYSGKVDTASDTTVEDSNGNKYLQYIAPNIRANGMTGWDKKDYDVFTPIAEIGVKFNIELTSKIKMNLGWSGIYAGNIARPTGMADFTLDMAGQGVMGLVDGKNKSDVFMHGFVFGLTINR